MDKIKAIKTELRRIERNWIAGRATDAQLDKARAAFKEVGGHIQTPEQRRAGATRKR